MLRFGDKKELYMWKANLGETRRVLSTELNPAILLDLNDIEVGSAIARVRPERTHTHRCTALFSTPNPHIIHRTHRYSLARRTDAR